MQLETKMPKRLPEAVQRQAEAMDAMDKEITGEVMPPSPDPDPAPPAPEPVPEPAPQPRVEDWEHKYKTLQGLFNQQAEVLRNLQAEVKALKDNPSAQAPAAAPEPPKPEPKPKLVTDADVENFGADLVDLMRRVVNETDGGEREKLMAEIADLKRQISAAETNVKSVSEVTAQTQRDRYFAKLAELVPDWETVNPSDPFQAWLLEHDPLTGRVRNDMLMEAFDAFDHVRTAAFFNLFKGQTPPAPQPPPAPPKSPLEAEVSPTKTAAPAAPTPDDGKKIWTAAEVQEFYNAVTRGDYRGMKAEVDKIDADIDRAFAEGRVRG